MELIKSKWCPNCGAQTTALVANSQLVAYRSGALIQDAFPQMDASLRERYISGLCSVECSEAFRGKE